MCVYFAPFVKFCREILTVENGQSTVISSPFGVLLQPRLLKYVIVVRQKAGNEGKRISGFGLQDAF
jgi:hypothetical protein